MTEHQWLGATEPHTMLTHLRMSANRCERKLRLFICACCRLIWSIPNDVRARQAIEVSEHYADGLAQGQIVGAYCDINSCLQPLGRRYTHHPPAVVMDASFIAFLRATSTGEAYYGCKWEYQRYDAYQCASDAADRVATVGAWAGENLATMYRTEAVLLRCIFGNPFRPSSRIGPSVLAWNDGCVEKIARRVYEERCFDLIPVLADALEEAGCDNQEILAHCRQQEGVHAKGCWVLDLLLQKE